MEEDGTKTLEDSKTVGEGEREGEGGGEKMTTKKVGPSYRFDLKDEKKWKSHLENSGYVVIASAVSKEGVEKAKDLLWTDIEKQYPGTNRKKPETWNGPPFITDTGIIAELAQSAGAWSIRGEPKVKEAFSKIWSTTDLLVSMDCVIAWRPWWTKSSWETPKTENMHLDQNPFHKPGLETVQGMVPLYPVTKEVGGLGVVPFSHTEKVHKVVKEKYPYFERRSDWCVFRDRCECTKENILLLAQPGDLILWDSRLIHGGKVGMGRRGSKAGKDDLARLSVTVCMTAKSRASEKCLRARQRAFRMGQSLNHTPHEAGTSLGTVHSKPIRDYRPAKLSAAQMELLC